MAIGSRDELRLDDGSELPSGASSLVLGLFDVWSPPLETKLLGRRRMIVTLTSHLERVPTDAELDAALEPLLQRGFIEARGTYSPPEHLDPRDRPIRMPPGPDDPDDGERVYAPTVSGVRAAHLCVPPRPLLSPWILGPERIDDQVLFSFLAVRSCNPDAASVLCATVSRDEIERAFSRCELAQLIERDPQGTLRLSPRGQLRAKELLGEVTGLVASWGKPPLTAAIPHVAEVPGPRAVPTVIANAVPAAVVLRSEAKLALLLGLNEEQLTRRVIIPMLTGMGFDSVTYNNGPNERGKDVIAW